MKHNNNRIIKKMLRLELLPKEKKYFNFHKKRYLQIIQNLKVKPGIKILDIGASGGHILLALNQFKTDCYAVDYNTKWATRFKKSNIQFKQCNIEFQRLPFRDNKFDYVIFSEVLEHLVENIEFPLNEIKRVLKKGGKIVLTTPNSCELGKRLLFLFGHNIYFDLKYFYLRNKYDRHNREFTMTELKNVLNQIGFHIKTEKYLASWEGLRMIEKNNLIAKLVSEFQKIIPSFRSNMIIIAKK